MEVRPDDQDGAYRDRTCDLLVANHSREVLNYYLKSCFIGETGVGAVFSNG